MRKWADRLKGFFEDRRGNVALIFGLSLPVMVLMTVGGVDIHRASTVRVNLQDALDASALAAARSPYTQPADIQRVGMNALRANLSNYPNVVLREDKTTFVLNEDQVVVARGSVDVKTLVANIFLPPYGQFMDDFLPVGANSEVNRSSKNLEVSLVLDLTGSMSGSRISDLKVAAKELVTMVVQDMQTPYYSKVALVPYSMGVNLGDMHSSATGSPTGYLGISNVEWQVGQPDYIDDITRSSTGEVTTTSGHGLSTGDYVWIDDVDGMYQINDKAYRVVRTGNRTFTLQYWNGNGWSTLRTRSSDGYSRYSRNGRVRKCLQWNCSVVISTSGNHGLSDGDTVYIDDVGGSYQINNSGYQVEVVNPAKYAIGVPGPTVGTFTRGGRSWCGQYGCEWRVFRNPYGSLKWFRSSDCVAERTGTNRYTDVTPSGSNRVQFNYSGTSSNSCPTSPIIPLSSDRAGLNAAIDNFTTDGSTAAQIGTAWGWYAVSPNFNSLWPNSAAGAYRDPDLLKAVVIMTDGEFNTPYCSGVIAQDAASGSGSLSDKIACEATNGDPFDQTIALCTAMKAQGVIVYTVGFQLDRNGRGAEVMNACASSGQAFLPASGADLSEAFKAIGRDITRLRISK